MLSVTPPNRLFSRRAQSQQSSATMSTSATTSVMTRKKLHSFCTNQWSKIFCQLVSTVSLLSHCC